MLNLLSTFIRPVLVEFHNVWMINKSEDLEDTPQLILLSLKFLGLGERGLIPNNLKYKITSDGLIYAAIDYLNTLLGIHGKIGTVNP